MDRISFVEECLLKTMNEDSKINKEILSIDGMSDSSVRHFLNNILQMEGTNYLEIGLWKGSTSISALYKNKNTVNSAILMDNYSIKFGNLEEARQTLLKNIKWYLELESGYSFTMSDAKLGNISDYCFFDLDSFSYEALKVINGDIVKLNKRNVYFYDGRHTEECQFRALTLYDSFLDDEFIYIIDDWKEPTVKSGTEKALKTLGYRIKKYWDLPFWCGYFVCVIEKTKPDIKFTCQLCGNTKYNSARNSNLRSCTGCNWSYIYR